MKCVPHRAKIGRAFFSGEDNCSTGSVLKTRLDKLLVDRGLTPSRERAQAMILAGKVLVNEQKIDKAGASVDLSAGIRLLGDDLRYVSRGGLKLEKALEHWRIDLRGKVCLDVGASTGGFSDCMLQHGAEKVIAVDTGYGQMDFGLRNDPRVTLLEKTNARYLTRDDLALQANEEIAFIAMDVSFISATLVLPAVIRAAFPDLSLAGVSGGACARSGAAEPSGGSRHSGSQQIVSQQAVSRQIISQQITVLVKPQFEVGRELVGKGGIVRDEAVQQSAVKKVEAALLQLGAGDLECIESPILGGEGNREFLLHGVFGVVTKNDG
jgi:23S rRNA (cytidine1920-2'-O)/16S rRNA (cytidine1409-2'-O)-methyltransferase